MKKLIVFAIVIICIGLVYKLPHSMLSPGELVEGHQKLNNDCFACHEPFWGIDNDKCIGCHQLSEIGKDTTPSHDTVANKVTILFHQNLKNQDCSLCHSDHKGLKSKKANGFNHEILNTAILNKCINCHAKPADSVHQHVSASCTNCHSTKGWKNSVVFNHNMIEGVDKNNCIGCHKKPTGNLHEQLSVSCKDCHNTKGWKNSVVFNHNMLKGVDKNNCISCHKKPNDASHSSFKDNCDKCHTTSQWKPSTFDHFSYFSLDEHHNAQCNVCHTNNNFSAYTCYGCHEHSESNISGEHNEHGIYNLTQCAKCHKSGSEHEGGEHENKGGERHGDD